MGNITIGMLQPFCGTTPKMNEPWSDGRFTYATNGFVLIRVPRIQEVVKADSFPQVGKFYEENPLPTTGWVNIPGLDVLGTEKVCEACRGAAGPICKECDGNGTLDFESDSNSYECECKSCHGVGSPRCHVCRGNPFVDPTPEFELAGARWTTAYLRLFAAFKNAQIASIRAPFKPTWIRFDGGDAFLMPLRSYP